MPNDILVVIAFCRIRIWITGVSLPKHKKDLPRRFISQCTLTKYEPKPREALQRYNETERNPNLTYSWTDITHIIRLVWCYFTGFSALHLNYLFKWNRRWLGLTARVKNFFSTKTFKLIGGIKKFKCHENKDNKHHFFDCFCSDARLLKR